MTAQLNLILDEAASDCGPEARKRVPVLRRSIRRGREGMFWRPTRRADVRLIIRAAERMDLNGRLSGKRNGPIGHIGLEVLRALGRLVKYDTGQLDPSYETIAGMIRRSRAAVIAACARLRAAGLLDWVRRYEPDLRPGERGPQVRQTSNAYRFILPASLARLLGVWSGPIPIPLDEEARQENKKAMIRQWEFEDTPLYAAIQRGFAAFRGD